MSLTDEMDMPRTRKTHRGRRSRGKGPKPTATHDSHAVAQQHIQAAAKAADPKQAHAHLFKAISALKKC